MLRHLISGILILHGLIHIMGLIKGLGWATIAALQKPIGKPMGLLWGLAATAFVTASVLLLRGHSAWWMPAAMAVVLSQALIVLHWRDARFGTLPNSMITIAVVVGAAIWSFRNEYWKDVRVASSAVGSSIARVITEADLQHLPPPIQRYLRSSGAVGHPKPKELRLSFIGDIRSKDGPWMPFTSMQVNTFDPPTRQFWMDATMKGLPTKGYHRYAEGTARMRIKLLGLYPVFDIASPELDTAETVTWFNDLCLFAPGALIDERISWEAIDDQRSRAIFQQKGIRISAELVFDDEGHLVDFISDDRYYLGEDQSFMRCRFSTPAGKHVRMAGHLVPEYGETVWHLPDGAFTYGRFTLQGLDLKP